MKTLELYAGTQSFTKGIKRADSTSTCVTVDISNRFQPTVCMNMIEWDYHTYPPGYFDVIWASPPCQQYSVAKTRGQRDLEGADNLVRKALEIIDYFQPTSWIIENVGTGLLVTRMEAIRPGLTCTLADYCAYGKSVRKRTAFWCNRPLELRTCPGVGACTSMEGRRHMDSVGNGRYAREIGNRFEHRNGIPLTLIDDIIRQLTFFQHIA